MDENKVNQLRSGLEDLAERIDSKSTTNFVEITKVRDKSLIYITNNSLNTGFYLIRGKTMQKVDMKTLSIGTSKENEHIEAIFPELKRDIYFKKHQYRY